MSSFQKHANDGTQCPDSRPGRRANGKGKHPRAAALMSCLLMAAVCSAAAPVSNAQDAYNPDQTNASRPPAQGRPANDEGHELAVPVRLHFAGSRQRPLVIATIGDFPANLGEAGKGFLTPEFFERFITDTLKLGGLESRTTLKIALLPQNNANERQCSFTLEDLEGHMSVVVMERRVLVVCTFTLSTGEKIPLNLASAESLYRPSA